MSPLLSLRPLLLVLALCACGPGLRSAARPYPAPTTAQVLGALRSRAAGLLALRAQARAEYLDNGQRVKISFAALAARPERLRIAGESALTGPLLTLATDGRRFQLLDVQHDRFLEGDATPCNVARLIRVELPPREVIEVLFGGVALLPEPTETTLVWDAKLGETLRLRDAQGRTEVIQITLPPSGNPGDAPIEVRAAELYAGGADKDVLLWRVRHEDFATYTLPGGTAKVRLPGVTYIEDPPHHSDVKLRWRTQERELNPNLPPDSFQLQSPPGIAREEAVCGG